MEIGNKYPCSTEGIFVDLETTQAVAGDIVEMYFDADYDITYDQAYQIAKELVKHKETYPAAVLHYFKVEGNRVTVQYSIGPAVGGITSSIALAWWIGVVIVIAALVGLILAVTAVRNGWLLAPRPPMGDAVVVAKDAVTDLPLHGVELFVDGESIGVTDGGSVTEKDLTQGDHVFSGGIVEGYQEPALVSRAVVGNEVITVTIWYWPEGTSIPTTGTLYVYTDPVIGEVYVDTQAEGPAPLSIVLTAGDHYVSFGPVEGYITAIPQVVTVPAGKWVAITGSYTKPGGVWWQDMVKWVAVGLAATAAAAILIPRLINAGRKQKK